LFCQRRGLKYVAISHANSESWEFDAPTCARMATAYGGAQKVYCVCEHNLRVLRSQTGSALPHGEIVKNPFNVSVDEPPAWPAENPWKMAGVARLDVTAKGQDLLFRVLAREEWQDRDYELNLYGTGPSEHDLREMARNLLPDRVRFHGHVEDIRRVWADNHMLVLPSRFEGLPLSLVEAMWCGRPAIVSNVGGNAELCLDGVTGFVAASASEAMLSEAMERAWHRRREWQSIGVAGRKRAEEIIPADPIAVFCRNLLQLG
jgi:glycosyltransferase involved in cell wall biosynthesis